MVLAACDDGADGAEDGGNARVKAAACSGGGGSAPPAGGAPPGGGNVGGVRGTATPPVGTPGALPGAFARTFGAPPGAGGPGAPGAFGLAGHVIGGIVAGLTPIRLPSVCIAPVPYS